MKPISDVKANAVQLMASYEARQETLALLEILVLGRRQVEDGRTVPADEAFRSLRKRPGSR